MTIKKRLDNGMYFIVHENGKIFKNAKGIVYYKEIRNAEKMKKYIERHKTAYNE